MNRNIDRYRGSDGLVAAEVLRHERLAEEFRPSSTAWESQVPLPNAKRASRPAAWTRQIC
jgi:hypothetical protein